MCQQQTSTCVLTAGNAKKETKPRKSLQFTTIEIRKYNRTLGDHPSCSDGPPVQLDWEYTIEPKTDIDEYEKNRLPRRSRRHLALTSITRRNSMYYHFGYTHDEIDKATESVKKIKKQRNVTKKLGTSIEKTQEVVQNVTRRIKRTFSREKLHKRSEWEHFTHGTRENASLTGLLVVR